MAYAIIHFFKDGTAEQYEASLAAVHPDPSTLPQGQILHVAGPSKGGWTVIAVHESKESWEAFRDNKLMPKMQEGVDGGFTAPPEETSFQVHNLSK